MRTCVADLPVKPLQLAEPGLRSSQKLMNGLLEKVQETTKGKVGLQADAVQAFLAPLPAGPLTMAAFDRVFLEAEIVGISDSLHKIASYDLC